ncbi:MULTISPECIES: GNAT family N-acetyltransferase [Flavobacterium]|uniref:GNAT family N-acetyltransferase n=1 Tax=Flavobacterium TaxID=237 RepID=UPI00086B2881|nr:MULTISPECIES: GNAT family N-acetyltransferase [Flavobacterium]MBN9285405.1 GNAT family N-acetyltransferase [Flavobacterium sp.]ODS85329.1 MAG: GNAT family N-acetyltransferase [Chryseobacterium sp. SCN 40-13]OJV71685.1 MAG: GNAT family N-acetyltransferase [Flavobacterium sp. 40-81]
MSLEFKIKRFNELSLVELYSVLQLRSEIFVVEQDCVYQDIDGKDDKALHVLGTFNGELVAYCRLFQPGDYFADASIGRVVVKATYRDKKWGHNLIREAINGIAARYNVAAITISAQLYLKKFYESHGFVKVSEEYLEDNIPHIEMRKA